jgi:hypothetical protein
MGLNRDSDKFFILGSGASIEQLSPENFAEIGRHQSVGINNWGLHPFVPDMYSFESVPGVGDGQDFRRSLELLNREDIIARSPALLVLRPKTRGGLASLSSLPAELRDRVFFYGRITPATRQTRNLIADFDSFFRTVSPRNPCVLLDSGASIVRMAILGIILGYRHLVFAGVDLNNSRYFWEENPLYFSQRTPTRPVNNQAGSMHETLSSLTRPFGVIQLVRQLSVYVEKFMGGTIRVSSPSSALAEFLDQHEWSA